MASGRGRVGPMQTTPGPSRVQRPFQASSDSKTKHHFSGQFDNGSINDLPRGVSSRPYLTKPARVDLKKLPARVIKAQRSPEHKSAAVKVWTTSHGSFKHKTDIPDGVVLTDVALNQLPDLTLDVRGEPKSNVLHELSASKLRSCIAAVPFNRRYLLKDFSASRPQSTEGRTCPALGIFYRIFNAVSRIAFPCVTQGQNQVPSLTSDPNEVWLTTRQLEDLIIKEAQLRLQRNGDHFPMPTIQMPKKHQHGERLDSNMNKKDANSYRAAWSLLELQREKEKTELQPSRYLEDLKVLHNIHRRELVSRLLYREAGQLFVREGGAGEPTPARLLLGESTEMEKPPDPACVLGKAKILREEVSAYWYSSVRQYRFNKDPNVLQTKAGSFSQMVWKSSDEFGLGKARSRNGKIIVVANYFPPGNVSSSFQHNVFPLNTRALAIEMISHGKSLEGSDPTSDDRKRPSGPLKGLGSHIPRVTGRNASKVLAAHMLGHMATLVATPDEELQVIIHINSGKSKKAQKRQRSEDGVIEKRPKIIEDKKIESGDSEMHSPDNLSSERGILKTSNKPTKSKHSSFVTFHQESNAPTICDASVVSSCAPGEPIQEAKATDVAINEVDQLFTEVESDSEVTYPEFNRSLVISQCNETSESKWMTSDSSALSSLENFQDQQYTQVSLTSVLPLKDKQISSHSIECYSSNPSNTASPIYSSDSDSITLSATSHSCKCHECYSESDSSGTFSQDFGAENKNAEMAFAKTKNESFLLYQKTLCHGSTHMVFSKCDKSTLGECEEAPACTSSHDEITDASYSSPKNSNRSLKDLISLNLPYNKSSESSGIMTCYALSPLRY